MNLSGANRLMGLSVGEIDGHAHVFRHDLPMVGDRRYTPDYNASLDDYAALLTENHLDGGLLVQPSFLGSDNSFLLECLSRAENELPTMTFRGVAVVEPQTTREELKRLSSEGIVGIRLNILMRESAFNVEPWLPVLQIADQLGWHVELHARGLYLPEILPKLLGTNQTIVVDHFGLPERSTNDECGGFTAISDAPLGRVLVKISAPYRVDRYLAQTGLSEDMQPVFNRLFEALGPENLVWGSDWPHTQHENQFSFSQSLDLRAA